MGEKKVGERTGRQTEYIEGEDKTASFAAQHHGNSSIWYTFKSNSADLCNLEIVLHSKSRDCIRHSR